MVGLTLILFPLLMAGPLSPVLAQQPNKPATNSWTTTMVVKSSGSCIDVKAGSSAPGGGIDQTKCTGRNNQTFVFTDAGAGFYTIHPQNDNLCLDAGTGPLKSAAQVTQDVCNGNDSQKWRVSQQPDGSYLVGTHAAGGCLDVYGGKTDNGTSLTTFNCHGSTNQSFMMRGYRASAMAPASNMPGLFTSTIVVESSKSCVEVKSGSNQKGAGIDEWTCTGVASQAFTFIRHPGGYYTIQAQVSHMCLDAGTAPVTSAAQIVQTVCSGLNSQKWRLLVNANGTYSITTNSGEGCFDVYAGKGANGTSLTTYLCHSADNQDFILSTSGKKTSKPTGSLQSPTRPIIFNYSESARPGDVVYAQGANFDAESEAWLSNGQSDGARPLATVTRVGNTFVAAQVPRDWSGAMFLRVKSDKGISDPVALNGPLPYHLDAMILVPGGAFRVLGRNLLLPGRSPSIKVNGQDASIDISASNENMLVATAPVRIHPSGEAVLLVDSGNGTGPVALGRKVPVIAGSGDPFHLGVGWGAGFTFTNKILKSHARCDGFQDDSNRIQVAIDRAARHGAVLQLPPGTCILDHSLVLLSRVVLEGAGKDVTILKYRAKYPISAENLDLVGIRNLSIVNDGDVIEGIRWLHNSRSFFQDVKIDQGVSHQMFLTDNRNMEVTQTDFLQEGSVGEQNPYVFNGTSGLVFMDNHTVSVDGSPTFQAVHDSLFLDNRFTRNAVNQNESTIISTHQFVMDFQYRTTIVGNTFDVINGPISNTERNDGETLLTEGGGGKRTESLGWVRSANGSTVRLSGRIQANPFGQGIPENLGISIVAGTGTGQTREIMTYSNRQVYVDHPWDMIPDSTSRYAIAVWGLEKTVIAQNTLVGNPRGIWIYQTAARDVDISGNRILNGGGIFLRTFEDQKAKQFDSMYNIRIAANSVSNSDGVWMSYAQINFVNKDVMNFGVGNTGVDFEDNVLTANDPNVTSTTEDYANREGFQSVLRSETAAGQLSGIPMLLGTLFQRNQCIRCSNAFVIGTGDYGAVLSENLPSAKSPNSLSDWKVLGPSLPGSIATGIQESAGIERGE